MLSVLSGLQFQVQDGFPTTGTDECAKSMVLGLFFDVVLILKKAITELFYVANSPWSYALGLHLFSFVRQLGSKVIVDNERRSIH